MKKTKIIYWISTGLLCAMMLMSAIQGILRTPSAVDLISTQLHYPEYFVPFTGVAKLLGVIVLLIPNFARIKEWAYAGFTFDLVGALYSMIAIGVPTGKWMFMFIFLALIAVSYIYYHKKVKEAV